MTNGNWSISMPRAATSVATRIFILPDLNSSSAWVRSSCERSPWIAVANRPSRCNWRARRAASRFMRVKISACGVSGAFGGWGGRGVFGWGGSYEAGGGDDDFHAFLQGQFLRLDIDAAI